MSAYRFCRTDDVPLLVDAWNRCGLPHFPGAAPLTAARFKQEIRELDLWCSSCMIAFDGKEPVAVLIGCKRPPRTLVLRIAVHPDHLRVGHGRHLLTSLSAKLAILGPPQLVAEIDEANAAARALFAACGWREERTYVDLVGNARIASPAPAGLVTNVTVEELLEVGLPAEDVPRSWGRTRATLIKRGETLQGLAIASGDSLDAAVLYRREDDGTVSLWWLTAADGASGERALGLLVGELSHRESGTIVVPALGDDEIPLALLAPLGFAPRKKTVGVATVARKA